METSTDPEMDVEGQAELTSIVDDFLTNGGNANDPGILARMEAFLKKDNSKKPLIIKPNKASFSPRINTKKKDKERKKRSGIKAALDKRSDSDSDSYENDFMPGRKKIPEEELPDNPVVKTSIPYYPLLDDTPVFSTGVNASIEEDEQYSTSAEEKVMAKLKGLCISNNEKLIAEKRDEALKEIEEILNSLRDTVAQRINDNAWRSYFVYSNTSDYVTEQDIEQLLRNYLSKL